LRVRLTCGNAALLEKMNVHIVDEDAPMIEAVQVFEDGAETDSRRINSFGTLQLTEDGAMLIPCEKLE
jgi:hypothetical protein